MEYTRYNLNITFLISMILNVTHFTNVANEYYVVLNTLFTGA